MIPVFAVLAVGVCAAGVEAAEDAAAKKIKELGGRVDRNRDKFGNPVDGVHFFQSKGTDEKLKQLPQLEHLTSLYLNSTDLTDAGLKHLARFQTVTTLSLSHTAISDEVRTEL